MGTTTAIAWTDHSFNPWWGCSRVSPGCDNCYAATFAKRVGQDLWATGEHRFFGDKHWAEPIKWDRQAAAAGQQHSVFCASMADVFELHPGLTAERHRLFDLIDCTPNLDWQLLTKRPENVIRVAPDRWLRDWPEHVWLGTTVEDRARANLRIPRLARVQGVAVRFLSCEPLLESLGTRLELLTLLLDVDWVIAGGESGAGHRPLDVQAARDLRDACAFLEIPFFFKQVGGAHPKSGGDLLDGVEHKAFPAVVVA